MEAKIIRLKCKHSQEHSDTYAAIAYYDGDSSIILRLSMHQYDKLTSPAKLQRIVEAINKGAK